MFHLKVEVKDHINNIEKKLSHYVSCLIRQIISIIGNDVYIILQLVEYEQQHQRSSEWIK